MNPVYLIVGSPGVGKSWVTSRLPPKFQVVEHDNYRTGYVPAIVAASKTGPVIANTPFGMSKLTEDLKAAGIRVVPVFIVESEWVLTARYQARENKPIPQGHLTRQRTYIERAQELGAFIGTSEQVLAHLRSK